MMEDKCHVYFIDSKTCFLQLRLAGKLTYSTSKMSVRISVYLGQNMKQRTQYNLQSFGVDVEIIKIKGQSDALNSRYVGG